MSKYVVGYISFHDNELKLEIVEAETELDAIRAYMKIDNLPDHVNSVERLHDFLDGWDCSVNALRLD